MHKSKLIRTLSILTVGEAKQFLPFLQSPYFNNNSNIVKLYRLLGPHHPDFVSPKLRKEEVFKKLFPGRSYAHQQLLNMMSEFYSLAEKYLVIVQLGKKEMEQEKLLLQAYAERPNCYDFFEKKFILVNKKMDDLPFRDELYFNEKKELNLLYYGHPDTSMQAGDRGTLHDAVEYFSASKKLTDIKLKCALNARANTIKEKKYKNIDGFKLLSDNQLFNLYDKLEKFQRHETEKDFYKLIDLFKSNIDLMRSEDQRNILKIFLNYCNRQTNKGRSDFYHNYLELYKLGLEHDCLLINGKMTDATFQNIIGISAACQAFEWARSFMKTYQNKLESKNKSESIALGMGLWYFEKKEFNNAIDAVQKSFQSPLHIIKSKSIMIRSWFELWCNDESYFELLINQLDAFEKFIRRNKYYTAKLKDASLKFIFYTKKIANAGWQKRETKKIKDEINRETNLLFKKWLYEKLRKKNGPL